MRRTLCLLTVVLAVPSLGSDAPKEYDGAAENAGIEGVWVLVSAGPPGDQIVQPNGQSVLIFRGGRWVYKLDGQFWNAGGYAADTGRNPASLDETTTLGFEAGNTRKFIYRLEGDRLRTAYRMNDAERPERFDEDGIHVCVWKRVKKEPATTPVDRSAYRYPAPNASTVTYQQKPNRLD